MFRQPAQSILYGGITIVIMLTALYFLLAGLYFLLDTWLPDTWLDGIDRCHPLICTEGYPCFEQGDCGPSPEL